MPKVIKHKCKTCPILTANSGKVCTECLNSVDRQKKFKTPPAQTTRAQQLGRAARALRCLMPRRTKEDWS